MKLKTTISFLLVFSVTASLVYAGESVTFKGTSKTGDAFMLVGTLNNLKVKDHFLP